MINGFALSQPGERHLHSGRGCEDYSTCHPVYFRPLDRNLMVAAVADGVGSCPLSATGSRVAAESLVTFLESSFHSSAFFNSVRGRMSRKHRDIEATIAYLMECAFSYAMDRVSDLASACSNPLEWYDTTLTAAVFDGSNVWWGHAGDDGIVCMFSDGECKMVTDRHEGEESDARGVVPLRDRSSWDFGLERKVTSLALMTDGMLDYCVSSPATGSIVNMPFLKPLLYAVMETQDAFDRTVDSWDRFLFGSSKTTAAYGFRLRDKIGDDLTIALMSNSEAVQGLPAYDPSRMDKEIAKLKRTADEVRAGLKKDAAERMDRIPRNDPSRMEKAFDEPERAADEPKADDKKDAAEVVRRIPKNNPTRTDKDAAGPKHAADKPKTGHKKAAAARARRIPIIIRFFGLKKTRR